MAELAVLRNGYAVLFCSQRRAERLDFSNMSSRVTNQSIRTFALASFALLAVWYALLGGGATLGEAIPAVARYGPPAIVAGPVDFAQDPAGWLVALGSVVTGIALLVAIRGVRRTRTSAARPRPLTPDDRMWAAHLAWLNECAARQARERGAKAA